MSKKHEATAIREYFQRILDQAKSLSEEDVAASLAARGRPVSDYFLLGEPSFASLICHWQNGNLMALIIEDNILSIATKLFLLRQGARVFKNGQEVRETATNENWL